MPFRQVEHYVVQGITPKTDKGKKLLEVHFISEALTSSSTPAAKSAKDYGISSEDLKVMGFDRVAELGRAVVTLSGQKNEAGKALAALNDAWRCQLEYQDWRAPYLIVKGGLLGAGKEEKPLLSNTLFLEKNKPALLGLTNLKEALILLVKLN